MTFNQALRGANIFDVPAGNPVITVTASKVIVSGPNWYGRTSMKVRNGITIMSYREADSHADNGFDQIMVMFSDDYGVSWTAPNVYLDASAVTGMPSYADAGVGDPEGAGEPWLYLMPNGDLVIHMWRSDYGVSNSGTYQIRSTDGGKSWSAPALVLFQFEGSTHVPFLALPEVSNPVLSTGTFSSSTNEAFSITKSFASPKKKEAPCGAPAAPTPTPKLN